MIFCDERLHDVFLCGEVAVFFSFTHSLTHSQGCVTFMWRGCMILFKRLYDFCCGEVV